ncbi:VIT domain-containing protein, partial [Planctomycetota bacterium]
MAKLIISKTLIVVLFVVLACCNLASAQSQDLQIPQLAPNIIMPQSKALSYSPENQQGHLQITSVRAQVNIIDQMALTTLDIHLKNPTRTRQSAELIMPVPDGIIVRGFALVGSPGKSSAWVLAEDEAKKTFDLLVEKTKDPALLEFIDYNLIRSSLFSVDPLSAPTVRLLYEHLLDVDINRVDYVLPRSERLDYNVPWDVKV